MKFVPNVVSRSVAHKVLVAKKQSPHIFFGLGVAGVVGSTVLACRATLKLDKDLDEIKRDLQNVKDFRESTDITDQEYAQELGHVYIKAAYKMGRLYGPSVILGGISIAALTGSHIQMTKRNAALTVTLAAVSKAFDDYRIRVAEEIGEERELELHRGISREVLEDTGEVVKLHDPNCLSPYARIFDEACPEWKKDPELNRIFIQCQQKYANDKLRARGHVFLNEVYDSLGLERSRAGAIVGWVIGGEGDDYIDFGMFETINARFINGMERSVILDFNVDGVVYDKI